MFAAVERLAVLSARRRSDARVIRVGRRERTRRPFAVKSFFNADVFYNRRVYKNVCVTV